MLGIAAAACDDPDELDALEERKINCGTGRLATETLQVRPAARLNAADAVSGSAAGPLQPGGPGRCEFTCSCWYPIDAVCSDGSDPLYLDVDNPRFRTTAQSVFVEVVSPTSENCTALAEQEGGLADAACTSQCEAEFDAAFPADETASMRCCLAADDGDSAGTSGGSSDGPCTSDSGGETTVAGAEDGPGTTSTTSTSTTSTSTTSTSTTS